MKRILLALFTLTTCLAASAQNIYGTFETWNNFSSGGQALEAPQGWSGSDSLIDALAILVGATPQKQVYKSTDKHGGTYAVRMVTANYGGQVDTFAGGIVNGKPSVNFSTFAITYNNLTPVTQRVDGMSFWTKYNPVGGDSAYVTIEAIKTGIGAGGADSTVGYGEAIIGSTPNYTQKTITITYANATIVPDRVLILIASSGGAFNTAGIPGSELFVDDAVINNPSGIAQPLMGQPAVWCFPNPSKGTVNFQTASTAPLTWNAYTIDGRSIAKQTFTGKGSVTITGQPAGLYIYRITDANGTAIQSGSFRLEN